jgi:hypothetical protein
LAFRHRNTGKHAADPVGAPGAAGLHNPSYEFPLLHSKNLAMALMSREKTGIFNHFSLFISRVKIHYKKTAAIKGLISKPKLCRRFASV